MLIFVGLTLRKCESDRSPPPSAEANIASIGVTNPTHPYAFTGAQG